MDSAKEFIAEAEELLEAFDRNLRDVEGSQAQGPRPEKINALFRTAHTLKGMSAMVGMQDLSELSHRLEDLLDQLRMGRLPLDGDTVDLLFRSSDVLRRLVAAGFSHTEKAAVEELYGAIENAARGSAYRATSDLGRFGLPPEITNVLTDYESHRLTENLKAKRHLYEVRTRLSLSTLNQEVQGITGRLGEDSELITTIPNTANGVSDTIEVIFLIGSARSSAEVQALMPGSTAREIAGQTSAEAGKGGTDDSARSLSETIRVQISRLDRLLNIVGELVLNKAVIAQISREMIQAQGFSGPAAELHKASQALDRRITELQEGLIEVRMVPVGQVFDRLVRIVRKLSRETGKRVELLLQGEDTQLDKSMVEALADPLMHLIRNAFDHGIEGPDERKALGKPEAGTIRLTAAQKGNTVVLEVRDDGRGIDIERVRQIAVERGLADPSLNYGTRDILGFLFLPGFTTRKEVTELSGRGVGLDVVARNLTRLNGLIDIRTEKNQGTCFLLTLPITLVIMKALIVRVASEMYAIPLNSVSESLLIWKKDIRTMERREVITLRDQTLPLLRVQELFGLEGGPDTDDRLYVVVVGVAEQRVGVAVNAIEGQQDIVIKSLGELLARAPGIAGATELGNRKTVLVLDVGELIEELTSRAPIRRKAAA